MKHALSVKWTGSPITARIVDDEGYEYKSISGMDIHLKAQHGQPATADIEMFLIGENDIREIRPTEWSIESSQKKVDYIQKLLDEVKLEINRLREISIGLSEDMLEGPSPDTQPANHSESHSK